MGESSETVSEPPGASAGAGSRTVFLSYASPDAEVANQVCQFLENHGVHCWMAPRDVKPGAVYADAIVRAINEASALVLVLSASASASEHVSREVERAASKHKQIVAFRVDAAALSAELEYFLSRSQWIDVPTLGMPAALAKLVEAVGGGAAAAQASPGLGGGKGSGGASINHPVGTASVAKRVVVAAAIVIAVGVGGVLAVRFWTSKHGEAPAPVVAAISEKSIAVLPFADMSQKKDQEYFGDGMAEEILDLLAKIPGLAVIGRTSSFQFKGKNEDLRKIGMELNAAYVLEGSVRNSGDQVRITAQLINTKTGAHEWSETYDRPIGDVLKLQGAIAAAVVRELQLTVAERDLLARSTVKNSQAYDLVLRGRHAADRFDKEGYDAATALFQQALDQDPTSADAAAELAFIYYLQGTDEILAPATAFEQARRAAATALKLDPSNPRAHYVLGKIHMVYDWDWAAAAEEFQQVAKLAPGSPDAPNGRARLSMALGRWDEALRHIRAALAQDPFELGSFEALAWVEMRRGHLAEAEAAMRRVLEIRPNYSWAHYYLGLVLLARGERDAALMEIQQERTDEAKRQGLAMVYYALDRKADSDSTIASMLQEDAEVNAFGIAEAYASRAEPGKAMQWLERAYAQKDSAMYYVKGDPPLKTLERDPRFRAFLKKMNLPE
jgi:TolB-like protein/Tfp pilus assembly protein PilF